MSYWPRMALRPHALRHAALVAAGALALHELRYRVGYGHEADAAVSAQGHGYLSWVAAVAVALALAVACAFALALVRRSGAGSPRGLARSWLGASSALAAIYGFQELLEGALVSGHPAGVAGLVGHGGWTAALFALALGGLIALAARGADQALGLAFESRPHTLPPPPFPPLAARLAAAAAPPRLSLLSLNLAGRAPPHPC